MIDLKEAEKRFWHAISGNCCVCGKALKAYENKYINMETGNLMCPPYPDGGHTVGENWYEWSDG